MKPRLIRSKLRNLFILALAAGMAIVYPAHIIVDHSGLFDHHTHHHHSDDKSPSDPGQDDELCAFCLTLSSMEAYEGQLIIAEKSEIGNYVLKQVFPGFHTALGKAARAPPASFDFSI